MTDSYTYLTEDSLHLLINEHTRALGFHHNQAARFGENNLPYHIEQEILSRQQSIKLIKEELEQRQEENGHLFITTKPITGQDAIIDISYKQFAKVNKLLDAIYHSLKDHVDPHSYNKIWVLRDVNGGYTFTEAGKLWANRVGLDKDNRPLREAGILPGMKLETIYAKGFFPTVKKKI